MTQRLAALGIDTSQLYDQLANSTSARGLQEAGLRGGYGEMERGLAQGQLDEYRTAEQQSLAWLADMFAGTPTDKGPDTTVQTTEGGGPSLFQQILGAGTAVAGAYVSSDERIKENVQPLEAGLTALRSVNPATYSYREGHGHVTGPTSGLMAQELGHIPGAVVHDGTGILKVDTYPVLATVVQAVKELDRRMAA